MVPWTSQEVQPYFRQKDTSYIQVLSNTIPMEVMSKTTYDMFRGASLMTLTATRGSMVFSPDNLPQKKEQWKNKCEMAIYKHTSLQKKVLKLQEEMGKSREKVEAWKLSCWINQSL